MINTHHKMVLPDYTSNKILDQDFQKWWQQYENYNSDYIRKADTNLFQYILDASPTRWYSRYFVNMYCPLARDTLKYHFALSLDYESLILGTAVGYFIAFRHFLDHRLCKSPQLRPGESFCTGRNNQFYLKWEATHINPRKYFEYNRKYFWRKFFMATPYALFYGVISTFVCHGFMSHDFTWVSRHFPLFIGTTIVTYDIFLYDKDYSDLDFDFYKHPELYALAGLLAYSVLRCFRNYAANVPFKRVIIG